MTWYDRNKSKVRTKRAEEYETGKAKVLERNKNYREKVARGEVVRTRVVDGVILYSLSTIAGRIGVDPRTLKSWELQEKIPKAYLVDKTRWYTLQDFITIQEIINAAKEDTAIT